MRDPLCPFCGAYSTRSCELLEETGGACPWEEIEDELEYETDEETTPGYGWLPPLSLS